MANGDQKVWNMANLVIVGMATIIAALVAFGSSNILNKIELGDAAIYAQVVPRLIEIKSDVKGLSETMANLQKDITRIDTLQKLRLEKEARDEGRRNAK